MVLPQIIFYIITLSLSCQLKTTSLLIRKSNYNNTYAFSFSSSALFLEEFQE